MTDLAHAAAAERRPSSRSLFATAVVLAVGGATVAGLVLGRWTGDPTLRWDPQLVVLLRFMAAVKFAGVLAASALSLWRARTPVSAGVAVAAVAALASMALAPGLIWFTAHVATAAALFHAGLLTFLVMAWRDDRVNLRRPRPVARRGTNQGLAGFTMAPDRLRPVTTRDGTSR